MFYTKSVKKHTDIALVFMGLIILLLSWQLIKDVHLHELRKKTVLESDRIVALLSSRLLKDVHAVGQLYNQINEKKYQTYQSVVDSSETYFKQLNTLESITFYYLQTQGPETIFYNPYFINGMSTLSKKDCDIALKLH